MKQLYLNYINSFKGLSREVWWLALITLVRSAVKWLVIRTE